MGVLSHRGALVALHRLGGKCAWCALGVARRGERVTSVSASRPQATFEGKPYTAGTNPTRRYRGHERSGRCPGRRCAWTPTHIRYTDTHADRHTVYLKAPEQAALVSHYRAKGQVLARAE